jgi:hypothetical protein
MLYGDKAEAVLLRSYLKKPLPLESRRDDAIIAQPFIAGNSRHKKN